MITLRSPSPPVNLRFFLLAIALHAVILFYPLKIVITRLEAPPPVKVMVNLLEAAAPVPIAAPAVSYSEPLPKQNAKKERPAVMPRTQPLAIASASPNSEASATVASVSAPVTASHINSTPSAPAIIVPARFDAAYLRNPQPSYPAVSRRQGEEGKVLLRVRVSPTGHSVTVDVEKSSNFMRLDEAARQAVSLWRFIPAKHGDEAVEATVIVPLIFKLDD